MAATIKVSELRHGDRIQGIGLVLASGTVEAGMATLKGTVSTRSADYGADFDTTDVELVLPVAHKVRVARSFYGGTGPSLFDAQLAGRTTAPTVGGAATDYDAMSVKALLALPEAKQIAGRHKMSKSTLVAALNAI